MLQIKNLSVRIAQESILENLNLEILDGEIHALMGPNGVGKSTICKVIMRDPNYEVTAGEILFNNENIVSKTPTEVARLGINLISQAPLEIEGVTNAQMLRSTLNEKTENPVNILEFNKKMESLCEKLEIPKSFIHREINVGMSGGERKKNELLHIWMLEPKFILLDEVDSGLDVDALKLVASSLKEYVDTFHASLLIITHHAKILEYLKPDKVHILKEKTIVQTGDASLAKTLENVGFKSITEAFPINGLDTNE